jgi:hypothetical protein
LQSKNRTETKQNKIDHADEKETVLQLTAPTEMQNANKSSDARQQLLNDCLHDRQCERIAKSNLCLHNADF